MNIVAPAVPCPMGQTQRMLEEALLALVDSSAAIVAKDRAHARELFSRLSGMGLHGDREELVLRGFGHHLYIVLPAQARTVGRGRSNFPIFVDHEVILD